MLSTEEVNQMWKRRVSAIQEENGDLVQHLRDEIERLQNRCNSLVYETTLMRANCAYDFKTICEGKCDHRGMVPMSVVYDIVKEYAPDGLVTIPDKYKGEGGLGKGVDREARKRSRFQSRKELSVAIKDPNNLGHIILDEETRREELGGAEEEDDIPSGYYSAHRKPKMNSTLVGVDQQQQEGKQVRLDQRRQDALHRQLQDEEQKVSQAQSCFFGQHQSSAPAGDSTTTPAPGVLSDPNGAFPNPQTAGSVAVSSTTTTAGGSGDVATGQLQQFLPLLDENAGIFFDNSANRKRPRWAGDLKYLNNNSNNQQQSQQQEEGSSGVTGGGVGVQGGGPSCRFEQFSQQNQHLYQEAEQDDLPDVEYELHSERPQRQLRFNYEDPYAKA